MSSTGEEKKRNAGSPKDKGNPRSNGQDYQKVVKKPQRIKPDDAGQFSYDDSSLPGSIIFIIADGKYQRKMILHHPIGVTDLDENDWVLSEPDDIRQMLLQKENPSIKNFKATALKDLELDFKWSVELYEKKGDSIFAIDRDGNINRRRIVSDAKDSARRAFREDNPVVKAEKGKKQPKAIPVPETLWLDYVQPRLREDELRFYKESNPSALNKVVERMIRNDPFRTRKGPFGDQPQQRFAAGIGSLPLMGKLIQRLSAPIG
jgi:hypothetical protein